MEDRDGPSYKNIFLVADPQRFAPYTGNITSGYDRELHFGLTKDDALSLESALLQDSSYCYTALPKLRYEPYEDQFVLPDEVRVLKKEYEHLKVCVSEPKLVDALDKLISISSSAERYHLGIFFVGE